MIRLLTRRVCFEQLDHVELAVHQGHHAAATRERVERRELAGAVHQRRGRHRHHARRRGLHALDDLGDTAGGRDAQHRVTATAEHVEQIVLTPHHALGHAGGATGVEQEQVVATAAPRRRRCGTRGDDVFVLRRPVRAGAGLVGGDDPPLHLRQVRPDAVEQLGEARMEHDGLGVGVVEQVGDLVRAVAVVGVHRRHRHLERRGHRLEVLDAVVQVAGHLGALADAGRDEVGGERVRSLVELAPGDHPVAVDLARPIGHRRGDGLVDVGKVPVGGRSCSVGHGPPKRRCRCRKSPRPPSRRPRRP